MEYLMALATKHWYALSQWAAGKRSHFTRSDIHERATDIIIYMLLLMYWADNKVKEE
jgi:hypothetical protein